MLFKILGILYICIALINVIVILINEAKYFKITFKKDKKQFLKAVIRFMIYFLFSPIIFNIESLENEYK